MDPASAARLRRLAIGTVQFGTSYGVSNTAGQVPQAEAGAILADAAARGVDLLDTAPAYGEAEEVLGRLRPLTEAFRIVTKTLGLREGGLGGVLGGARASLERLGRRQGDVLLVHAAADLRTADGPALWQALRSLQGEGLYRAIGISAYVDDDPLDLAARFRPDVMQLPVSFLDQRLVKDGALSRLADLGIEIHARSVFLQGLVFLDPARLPPRLAHAAPLLEERAFRIAAARASTLSAALHFALNRPEIARIVVGVTSLSEWREVAATAAGAAPDLAWDALAIDDPLLLSPARW